LFFVVVGALGASDEELRQALDQLSGSYADAQRKLVERDAALRTLTESLAIARTESELFQKLWAEAQVRVQTLGANLSEADGGAQREFVETLRALYLAEAERQRLAEQLTKLVTVIESNGDVAVELEKAKRLLAASEKPVSPKTPVRPNALESAKVLEVSPKLRLVVLDVGAQQGARIGMPMIVLRGNREVAGLRIVEVRQKICGALIEKIEHNVTLQAGDTARVTKS
jgi:hypothetical protein